jgi:hypothetical protein
VSLLWRGSMVTPVGTPEFWAIVLPIPKHLLYLGSLAAIYRNQAVCRRRTRTFASMDRQIDRQEEQDLQTRWEVTIRVARRLESPFTGTECSSTGVSTALALLLFGVLCFCLYSGHVLLAAPTLTYPLSWRSCTATAHHLVPPHYKDIFYNIKVVCNT